MFYENRRRFWADLYSRIIPALRGIRTSAAGFREKSVNALIAENEENRREGRRGKCVGAFKFDAWICRMTSGGNEKKRE